MLFREREDKQIRAFREREDYQISVFLKRGKSSRLWRIINKQASSLRQVGKRLADREMLAGTQKVEQADRLGERQKERDKKYCPDGQILTCQMKTRLYCHI